MTDSTDNRDPLFLFLTTMGDSARDPADEAKAREAFDIWRIAMQDSSVAYAKRRSESFTPAMREFVLAHKNGQTDNLPTLSPMAVLQSEVIGTISILLADLEAMLQNAGASGDLEAVVAITRSYVGLKRASSAFAQVHLP